MSILNENSIEASSSLQPIMGVAGKVMMTRAQVSASRRRQFRRIGIFIQILVSIASLSLPVVWGLARATTPKGMNNLSPVEKLLLGSRLEGIKTGIQNDYSSCSNAETRTFIFPGAGGVDALVEELQACKPNSMIVDWKEYRGSILTASFDSEAVGEAIAELVLKTIVNGDNQENSIQFIGISVGGFAANAAATVVHRHLKENNPGTNCDTHLVLLDPFCGRGVVGPNYGRENFGKHATTALQILNTDDPVPTTNEVLPLCYCIDVTDAPEKKNFVLLPGDSMHSWPLAYYARHYNDDSATPILPRGKVKKVS